MGSETVVSRKDEQSAEPCLVVNAEARKISALDAKAPHRRRRQDLTDDGSETIVGVAGGSSCYSKLCNKENNSSSREMHVDV